MIFGKVRDGRYRFGPLMVMTKPMHWFAPVYEHTWAFIVDNNDHSKVTHKWHNISWGGLTLQFCTKVKPGDDLTNYSPRLVNNVSGTYAY